MVRLEQLLEESQQAAHELAEALREHKDEATVRSLQERLDRSQRAIAEETERVKEEPSEA
jgi:hypothetical protein